MARYVDAAGYDVRRCDGCGNRMPLWGCDRNGNSICYDCERARARCPTCGSEDCRACRTCGELQSICKCRARASDERERERAGLPTLAGTRAMFDALDRARDQRR